MMIVSVAVVTDSTAYSPANLAERNGVRQVPLHVLVDDRHRLNGKHSARGLTCVGVLPSAC
jgi:fatty acid-binding protein DegV